jgi:hypothetical protein
MKKQINKEKEKKKRRKISNTHIHTPPAGALSLSGV